MLQTVKLGILGLVLIAASSSAEVIRIPIGQQTAQEAASLPRTGVTKEKVRQQQGEPLEIQGPTGEPAIYRWDYSDFTVYFENDRVIHSVIKFIPQQQAASE